MAHIDASCKPTPHAVLTSIEFLTRQNVPTFADLWLFCLNAPSILLILFLCLDAPSILPYTIVDRTTLAWGTHYFRNAMEALKKIKAIHHVLTPLPCMRHLTLLPTQQS